MNMLNRLTCLSAGYLALICSVTGGAEPCCQHCVGEAPQKVCCGKEAANLTVVEMKKVVESKSATVLDARTGKYDDGRRIPGARALDPKAEASEIAKMLPDKSAPIVTYCGGLTCPASETLAKRLKDLGYTNVREYPEGIQGWVDAGNAVEGVAKK